MFPRTRDELEEAKKYFHVDGEWSEPDDNGALSVKGDCSLEDLPQGMTTLPLQFKNVTGDFDITAKGITSLIGCPEVIEGAFRASSNNFLDLKYSPKEANHTILANCNIKSLNGFHTNSKYYDLSYNNLTSVKGLNPTDPCTLVIYGNNLSNVMGIHSNVRALYLARVKSLKEKNFELIIDQKTPITSLEGLSDNLQMIVIGPSTPLLELLMLPNLILDYIYIGIDDPNKAQTLNALLKKYKPLGPDGVVPMAFELRKYGYNENARL